MTVPDPRPLRSIAGGSSLTCARGHSFDIARHGYVSLLAGAGATNAGDTASMLASRDEFLRAGHFAPIAATVTGLCDAAQTVAEIGAGTGHYLAEVLDTAPAALGVALDIAKPAARRCAGRHPRMAAVVADVWRGIPMRDGALTHVLSVFAPRNAAEVHRVLIPEVGRYLVVTPNPEHLRELITPLGMVTVDERKPARLADALSGHFTPIETVPLHFGMPDLNHTALTALVAMGPTAHHLTPDELATRVATLPERLTVTASVTVSAYITR